MTNTLDGKRDFFISFNRSDRSWATWIAWVLEEKGYSVFFQDWDFKGNFVLEMDKVHQQSRRTLAVVSPNYFASSFTAPEWATRFKEEATSQYDLLIPVRVREFEPPSLLSPIVYVDLVGLDRDQARCRLLEHIAGIRMKPNEGPFHPEGPLPAAARSIPSEPYFPGGKAIVVLSDGTGNSAAKLFKTNVWRLYQALDLAEPPPTAQGAARQIAYYDDGVGTSSFRPLALLGGIFGWGLKRNVLDLYAFICRNYEPGDRIYAFGFSRGAFTIRILVDLIAKHDVLHCPTERELAAYARDTYRAYRYCFNQTTGSHVHLLRRLRDAVIAAWRRKHGMQPVAEEVPRTEVNEIAFVGVWDTVGAYGTPITELTRGIDKWVWPLSMPNCALSAKVKVARHALALDDERDTFHPLLWDELAEQELIEEGKVDSNRMRQVWFTGMHSDVGGGYPDDALAHVPLDWMMRDAAAAGLRFKQQDVDKVKRARNEFGPIHDSRHGLAGYYRYQPRRISAMMHLPDPTCLIMQNPDPSGRGRLTSVNVHESVLERIKEGPDRYAPIVLPERYEVVRQDGSVIASSEVKTHKRATRQEWVWDDVWRRRVAYFTMVGASLSLALLPLVQQTFAPSACVGPQCLLKPVITGIGDFLPGFTQPWIQAFGDYPGLFAVLIAAIALLLLWSGSRQRRIKDSMGKLWRQSLRQAAPDATEPSKSWVYLLRTYPGYQKVFQVLKWKIVPTVFGLLLLVGGVLLVLALLVAVATSFGKRGASAQQLATERTVGSLEVAATFNGPMPTGVTVSKTGRIFVNFPKWGDPVEYTVAEVKNGQTTPYPDATINSFDPGDKQEDKLVSVQSVVVDARDRLWILDTGAPARHQKIGPTTYGGPKLIGTDLTSNRIVKKIVFPPEVAKATTYLNDVRFDLRRGAEGMAFITDSSAETPGIIVVDLASGRAWRRLDGHASVQPDPNFAPVIEGELFANIENGKAVTRLKGGSDGIAISPDGKTLYYCPLSSRHLYSMSVDALADQSNSEQDVEATVRDLGEKGGASDGLELDAQGRVYLSDYEHNAIHRRAQNGAIETIAHDPQVLWPDTLSLAGDGYLYFTANQLHRQPQFYGNKDLRQKPYVLFKVKVDGTPIQAP